MSFAVIPRPLLWVLLLWTVGSVRHAAFAQDAGDAGASQSDAATSEPAPRLAQLQALVDGSLDVAVDPQSLFEIPLSDEASVQVEALRIETLLRGVQQAEQPAAPARKRRKEVAAELDASVAAGIGVVDPALWNARLALDRARLAFYALSSERRREILRDHAQRREAAKPGESQQERLAREAEQERQEALRAARAARSEAERLVSEELARLIALQGRVATVREKFRAARAALDENQDLVLGLSRRARDAKLHAPGTDPDATYDALRRALRSARDELSRALDDLTLDASEVPSLFADALEDLPSDVSTERVRERRALVARAIQAAEREKSALREDRARLWFDDTATLNRERLAMLPHLSSEKQDAITGFTSAGWDQARSEARHLTLVLRYHLHAVRRWMGSLRAGGGPSIWLALAVGLPWFLLAASYVWVRRRVPLLLALAQQRSILADRAKNRTSPSAQLRSVRFLIRIHTPLLWLGFFLMATWLLPSGAQRQLEVQLVILIVGWMIGGALVVNIINAVAAGRASELSYTDDDSDALRLRSLRLVGRTVVAFALFLLLSSRLVGEGTIYSWVLSTCWFAALPVFLILVRWWRSTLFMRLDRVRKKTPLEAWILENRTGWKSFLAAMIGAVHLFGTGMIKAVRAWLSGFDLARRAHAYLFKRELERLNEGATSSLKPLRASAIAALHPEAPSSTQLSSPTGAFVDAIAERVESGRGGVIALVGGRGMGKSSLLLQLRARVERTVEIACSSRLSNEEIVRAAALSGGASRVPPAAAREQGTDPPPADESPTHAELLLLDSAHSLVKPVVGGLATFDRVITLARANCARTTWVFAIDAVVWPFLKRARDARPLFDEVFVLAPWNEDEIGALIMQRCRQAGIEPTFADLLDKLPPGSDEIDRLDALKLKQQGYVRMLWDHVRGNPGLALEAFRCSLAEDDAGVVHVRPLQVPETARLDELPDSSLFVLRAVLQLSPAAVSDVAQATRLSHEQVVNAFRFGQTQGYFSEEQDGRVRVTWRFLRPVLHLLERRHLLVNP